MNNENSKIVLEDQENDFLYVKSKSNLNLSFNRISFIFFIFFIIFLIYSIQLIHLGTRKPNVETVNKIEQSETLFRALVKKPLIPSTKELKEKMRSR